MHACVSVLNCCGVILRFSPLTCCTHAPMLSLSLCLYIFMPLADATRGFWSWNVVKFGGLPLNGDNKLIWMIPWFGWYPFPCPVLSRLPPFPLCFCPFPFYPVYLNSSFPSPSVPFPPFLLIFLRSLRSLSPPPFLFPFPPLPLLYSLPFLPSFIPKMMDGVGWLRHAAGFAMDRRCYECATDVHFRNELE